MFTSAQSFARLLSSSRHIMLCKIWKFPYLALCDIGRKRKKAMLKIKGTITGYEVRRKSDGKLLYVLGSGEVVFCSSVATVFPTLSRIRELLLRIGYPLKSFDITRI